MKHTSNIDWLQYNELRRRRYDAPDLDTNGDPLPCPHGQSLHRCDKCWRELQSKQSKIEESLKRLAEKKP